MRFLSAGTRVYLPIRAPLRATRLIRNIKPLFRSESPRRDSRISVTGNRALSVHGPEMFSAPNGGYAPIDMVRVRHRIPNGTYTAEEFVRTRVAGVFFFKGNINKSPVGWTTFSWLLLAIFLRNNLLGLQRRLHCKRIGAFFVEARKGSLSQKPLEGSY